MAVVPLGTRNDTSLTIDGALPSLTLATSKMTLSGDKG